MAQRKRDRVLEIAISSDANLLLSGATGTGKSTLARKIHDSGPRRFKPFISVNLATLHEGTLESELFGHERGAFTGAEQRRVGRLEQAQGGTVFLDEIGELSPRLQARLLEFLQSKTVVPVGSNRAVPLDVRVIAATHRDLDRAVSQQTFRQDLLFRIRVLEIRLADLKQQSESFDEIVHQCIQELAAQSGKTITKIDEDVACLLENHPWPGNFRELRNVLEFAVLSSQNGTISRGDLPAWFLRPGAESVSSEAKSILGTAEIPLLLDYESTLAAFEGYYLRTAFQYFNCNASRTAREIRMSKATLLRRLRILKLAGAPSAAPNPA